MKKCMLIILISAALLCSCAPPAQQAATSVQEVLVVYTSHRPEIYEPIFKEFQERTGIWVVYETGGGVELLQRVQEESAAPVCDVVFGGGADSHMAYSAYLQAYQSNQLEHVPAQYYPADAMWTPFSIVQTVLIYNTKTLSANTAPTSWEDILQPEWQGKIAFAQPEVSASCFTTLAAIAQIAGGVQAVSQLATNMQGVVLAGSADIPTAVADGRYPVGIALEEAVWRLIQAGEQLAIVYPADGAAAIPDATSIVQGAKNLTAAQQFVDFTLSYDMQQMLSQTMQRRPVRSDVPTPAGLQEMSGIVQIYYDYEWSTANRELILEAWRREF